MKFTIKNCIVFLLFITINNAACNKNNGTDQNNKSSSTLSLSKSSIKRGERLNISSNTPISFSKIKWSVFPSAGSEILPANERAAAIFALAGSYRITASYFTANDSLAASDSTSVPVTVTDSIYSGSPVDDGLDTVSLEGDQITLIPVSASDSGFVILAKTNKLYHCTPYLTAYGTEIGPSSLVLYSYGEVVEGAVDCKDAKNPALAYLFFNPLQNGSYNISAILNNVTYQGSLTVTNTDYIFTWNYTSGILIAPLQIKKQ